MGSNRTSRNFTPKSDEGSAYVRPSVPVSDKPTFTSSEEDEHLRGTGSYFAVKELFEGTFIAEVNNYMSFEKGVDCLNIGCSSGAFLMDAAVEFPRSNFVGVDTVPMADVIVALPNITFILGNFLNGLDIPENSFDYIHMRAYGNILTSDQWPIALKEIYRLLKPGGCVGFLEYESRETGNEDCARVFIALKKLMESYDQEPYAGHKLKEWVVDAGLEHIKTEEANVDCGPDTGRAKRWRWFWTECCKFIGPQLAPVLEVSAEDWPEFVFEHVKDMERYHGHITVIRSLARKPLK